MRSLSWQIPAAPPALYISAGMQLVALAGALVTIAGLLAGVLPFSWRGFGAALVCYALVTLLVLTGLARHLPHHHFGLANSVTLTRAALAALLWGVIAELAFGEMDFLDLRLRWVVVGIATAALLSDGVDGWAARRSGMASDFGAHFDMEVDAVFLLALSILVYATGEVGAWVIASGMLRYGFVLAGYVWPRLAAPLLPLWGRKAICVLQMVVLIVALAPVVPAAPAQLLCLGGLALLSYSFASDLIWLVTQRGTRAPGRQPLHRNRHRLTNGSRHPTVARAGGARRPGRRYRSGVPVLGPRSCRDRWRSRPLAPRSPETPTI